MKDYKRLTSEQYFSCRECVDGECQTPDMFCPYRCECERYNQLYNLEDKIERGELVGGIWFKSWLNGNICCGRVIGYGDGGFVIEIGDNLISAEKIYTSREEAENSENKNDSDLPF